MDSRAVPLPLWEWCFYRDPIFTPVGDFLGVGSRVSLLGVRGGDLHATSRWGQQDKRKIRMVHSGRSVSHWSQSRGVLGGFSCW